MSLSTGDKFEESILVLDSMTIKLYGGYYEPRSERDRILADKLWAILQEPEALAVVATNEKLRTKAD